MSTRSASGVPPASLPPMLLSPIFRLVRRLSLPIPFSLPASPSVLLTPLILALTAAIQRLDLSTDPRKTLHRLSSHKFTPANTLPLAFMLGTALYSLYVMSTPYLLGLFPIKLFLPIIYIAAILLPISGQFVWPATPIFAWLLLFFCCRFIPSQNRPDIHVALLPALESVLYGANISDLQTRYTNAFLDVVAWLPYGVMHFALPFIVALFLWVFGPRGAVKYWGKAFGWMNLLGVCTQILLPCAAPWYEIIHGLTPANYAMPGSPGGLLRIDRVFHGSGYANTFGAAPLVFGAFPSLHSGCAVMEALFLSHFFPAGKVYYWMYAGTLWWATMYLSHHYLIDLTGGACLSVVVFYVTMPEHFKDSDGIEWGKEGMEGYEMVDGGREVRELDLDEEIRKLEERGEDEEPAKRDEEIEVKGKEVEEAVVAEGSGSAGPASGKVKAKRSVSWGETRVLGELQSIEVKAEGAERPSNP